jgi:cytochrome c biogenesis protein
MANVAVRPQPTKSPIETVIDRVWRFFCSVRWAVIEIAFLALLVLIGTLRGSEVPQWIANIIPGTQGFVDVWYDWDVYHSGVFAFMLTLLSVAIAVCTLNRAPGIWQAISNPTVTTTRGFLRNAEMSSTYQVPQNPEATIDGLTTALKKHRYRTVTKKIGNETHIYADKNRYAKLGTFPFHLALILLLLGGIVAARYGFRDQEFVISEGQTENVGHGTGLSLKLNEFTDSYTQVGIADQFESDVVIYEDGKEVKSGTINVNHPMSYGTATFYQSSILFAAQMTVSDPYGNQLWTGPVDLGVFHMTGNDEAPAGFVDIPEAGIRLTVVGPDVDPLSNPDLDTLKLKSGQMWVQVQTLSTVPGSAVGPSGNNPAQVVNQADPATIGPVQVTFDREVRSTVLQIANNPGIPLFVIAALMMVGGLVVVFYFPQRRIRGMVTETADGAVALLAPLARRDWSGKQEFLRFARSAEEVLDTAAIVKQPEGSDDWEEVTQRPAAAT